MLKFDNRVAVIIGLDGVGVAVAKAFAINGVKLALADENKNLADKIASEIGNDAIAFD